jgi:hypothetical protein
MPNYEQKALKQFQHKAGKLRHAPYQSTLIQYGTKKQYATQELEVPLLDDKAKRFIQQVCGKFLFLGRAVDSTILCPISAIALQSSKPTEDIMQQTLQLLDYLATQEDLLPRKRHGASSTQQHKLFEQAKSTKPSGWTLFPVKRYNCPTKQWGNSEHSTHH